MNRVYASLPLQGPQRRLGRELLRGAELALERAGPVAELVAELGLRCRIALERSHG